MMKLVILSAYEIRHKYLLGNIYEKFKIEKIIIEKKSIKPKFKTFHKFEIKREKFEKNNNKATIIHVPTIYNFLYSVSTFL